MNQFFVGTKPEFILLTIKSDQALLNQGLSGVNIKS